MRTDHPGTGNCFLHAGATPSGIKAASKEAAELAVVKLGLPSGSGDPFALLEKAVRYGDGFLDATGQLLAEVVDAAAEAPPRAHAVTLEAAAALHVRAIRQASTTAGQAVEADVAARLATIDERKIDLLQLALQSTLSRMGAEPEYSDRFLTTLGEELVKITAPAALVAARN